MPLYDVSPGMMEGLSFPPNPSDAELFYRSDRRIIYEWDATSSNWLSVDRKYFTIGGLVNNTSTGNVVIQSVPEKIYVDTVCFHTFTTTLSGSAFWTVTLSEVSVANSATTLVSFTNAGDTAANWTNHDISVATVVDPASFPVFQVTVTKTGSPSALYSGIVALVRSVG